jgi:signal transduction histidine kinase/HAMP domain-containing protein
MKGLAGQSLKPLGFLCLLGQGILLFQGGGTPSFEGMPHPGLVLLLTLVLALAVSLGPRKGAGWKLPTSSWSIVLMLSISILIALSLKTLSMDGEEPSSPRFLSESQQQHRAQIQQAWQELNDALPEILASAVSEIPDSLDKPQGGDLFRKLNASAENWAELISNAGGLTLEGVIWEGGQRSAWTRGAEPLDLEPGQSDADLLKRGRHNWFRRITRSINQSLVLELQVPLTRDGLQLHHQGLKWQVLPLNDAPLAVRDSGEAVPDVVFQDPVGRLGLVLVSDQSGVSSEGGRKTQARIMVSAGLAWFLALLAVTRLWLGGGWFLAALWAGRVLLAAEGFFRWGTWAFHETVQPAGPSRLISLLDPAYFATPFAYGLFASTADALLTAVVVAVTAWAVLNRLGFVGVVDESGKRLPSQGPVSGLIFGLAGTAMLLLSRFLAAILATNANPRLIGQDVPLPFISFWCLHLVLMLLVFSFFALLVGLWGGRSWPDRSQLSSWLVGGLLAFAGAFGASLMGSEMWWGSRFLLALTVLGLWLVTPSLGSRPHFLRRFVWPVVLLMAVVWNYASLSQVYQRAEHDWLLTKGDKLTESSNPSAPYLLDEALWDMRNQDEASGSVAAAGQDVWRDEPAYLLWRNSSLRDLGFPMMVEIIDEYGREESLFTTGFMGDFSYQVGYRAPVDSTRLPSNEREVGRMFEEELRLYPDGEEFILAGEVSRQGDRGWIRVEFPVRSRRISTQLAGLAPRTKSSMGGYSPRSEVDRPVLLLRGDDIGWLDVGHKGIPKRISLPALEQLKSGELPWLKISVGEDVFLCVWKPVPLELAHSPGEGYLLGVQQATLREKLLDLSRIMLLNLVFLAGLVAMLQIWRKLQKLQPASGGKNLVGAWSTGFQERFLVGYLFFGLMLLLVVGTSVDRVGHDRVRAEARSRTRAGLDTAVQQLRSLLVEQARSLSRSDYINDMLIGQLSGQRPVSPIETRQAMVYGGDGTLLLDETLSDLSPEEAQVLLAAGRTSPMVVMDEDEGLFVATVIPIDLSGVLAVTDNPALQDQRFANGFFLYRQRLDRDLMGSLADLVQGQATLRLGGRPVLASHPEGIFSGNEALLADPEMMGTLLGYAQAAGVFAAEGRPFAFTGAQPLPAFSRIPDGGFQVQVIPAVLAVAFPDREKEYGDQRRATILFLAGLANLILLTALLLALLMSWNLFRPLRLLLTATKSMARGDFNAPLPEAGRDEVGRLTSAFGGMRSELSTAKESLEAREKFLSSVLDRVTVGVAVIEQNRQVVSLNPAGRNILTDFDPSLLEDAGVLSLLDRFLNLAEGRPRWGGEMRSADGLRTLRGAMAPLDLPDGRIDTMLVFEDITEFLQTRKMAINAELARQVAHEIKNPLTPIQLSVQLLQQAWQDNHPQLDHIVPDTVKRVLAQVDLLRSIAAEFSLLGRPGDLEREAVDLLELVSETVDKYGMGDRDSSVIVNLEAADLPLVLANQDSLQKILGNLMQNSLDAVFEGEKAILDLQWKVQRESVTLLWSDRGTGLNPEVADRLFDPYFSTKSKGTGLGLAISRNLADRMGGSIILRNRTDGPGARAELTLPRLKADNSEGPGS